MKNSVKLTNIIESILFVSGTQVSITDMAEKLDVDEKEINAAIKLLKEKYGADSGIQLLIFNKKIQFASNPDYVDEVSAVLNPIREKELSRALLEVAAIIAYKQPVTRIDLDELRGVNSQYAIDKLLELKMIEPIGRKDAVGRPVLYATTDEFLKRFQISSLDELPNYEDLINRIELIHADDKTDDYLYRKDEYVEEVAGDNTGNNGTNEVSPADSVAVTEVSSEKAAKDDFYLPDIDEEELPDFLKGEDVEKF